MGRSSLVHVQRRAGAFDGLRASTVVLDASGVIVETNEAWRLFAQLNDGDAAATGVGVDYLAVCDRAAAAGATEARLVADQLRSLLAGGRQHLDVEYAAGSPSEDRWYLLQASAVPTEGGGAVVSHVDVTARKLLEERLVQQADHDPLTGLPNRRSGSRFLEHFLDEAHGVPGRITVAFVDLDGFAGINDALGRAAADQLLIQVTARARRIVRQGDLFARFGGDEFLLVARDLSPDGAQVVARRLRLVLAEPFQLGATEVTIGASIGMATNDAESTPESLLAEADAAMCASKAHAV
ncbi:MAG: Diguanylate cyclase/phosphodiesterase with sensor(S), partial [Acidimicrobiales bacterium]|nr:Diguanylate cyclase/phosphodiesterase with sensor(S) [Acidimicrobiales bacterium]